MRNYLKSKWMHLSGCKSSQALVYNINQDYSLTVFPHKLDIKLNDRLL